MAGRASRGEDGGQPFGLLFVLKPLSQGRQPHRHSSRLHAVVTRLWAYHRGRGRPANGPRPTRWPRCAPTPRCSPGAAPAGSPNTPTDQVSSRRAAQSIGIMRKRARGILFGLQAFDQTVNDFRLELLSHGAQLPWPASGTSVGLSRRFKIASQFPEPPQRLHGRVRQGRIRLGQVLRQPSRESAQPQPSCAAMMISNRTRLSWPLASAASARQAWRR